MSEGYALLSVEENGKDSTEFEKLREFEDNEDDFEVPYTGRIVRAKRSPIITCVFVFSVILNVCLLAFLFWTHFSEGSPNIDGSKTAPMIGAFINTSTTVSATHNIATDYPDSTPPPSSVLPAQEPVYCNDDVQLVPPEHVNIFQDLGTDELMAVKSYLLTVSDLKLTKSSHVDLYDNFIFSIELHTPNKSAALQYLDNKGVKPAREAKAVLFLPSYNPPIVSEYVVGSLPNPSYHYINPRRSKPIDYRVRQFNNVEMGHAIQTVHRNINSKMEDFLKRHFSANFYSCWHQCLSFISAAVSSVFSDYRKLWINAMYKVDFTTIHPIGFQFLVNLKGLDSSKWYIEQVWYAGRSYKSFDELIQKYERGELPRLHIPFPKSTETKAGTLNIKGKQFPKVSQAGPRQYEPQGHRYTIKDQHVEYLQHWMFDFRMSYAGAIQLYDIRFGGDRIAYEISLQEVCVLYAGANPSSMFSQLADSSFSLSKNSHGLVPGVDCPDHATFLPVTLFDSSHSHPYNYPNSICIFEHNSGVPARRHKSHNNVNGHYYHGLVDNVLILRTVYVMYNYDYVLDFIFHQNGGLEVKVYSTGYILSAFYTEDEKPFGFKIFENTAGSIHHHLFNFKVDVDVLGTTNRYQTLNFKVDNSSRSWLENEKSFPQLSFEREVKQTEKQATHKMNFDTPKYHIFTNNYKQNAFGETRGYRMLAKGFTKQLLPEDSGALNSFTWSRYQIAVTKRKDEEETSSSMHAIFDSGDPVVSLQRYIDDDEDIVDQDVVAWVTLGMYHIPHTEDIPNTPTLGTDASIVLLPYNYFQECPSMGARDAVRVEANPDIKVNRHDMPHEFHCIPKHMSNNDFKNEKNNIFMSTGKK